MSVFNQELSNQECELSSSSNAIAQEMDEAPQDETMSHNRNRWSSSDASGSSSIATFFEIVNPPSQLVSSPYPNTERFQSNVVVVIEDSYSTAFEFEKLLPFEDYECQDDLSALSRRSSLQNEAEDLDDGTDRLDGRLLPDFFTYTSEERELIRRNLPILRTQLEKTEESSPARPGSVLPRENKNYHLPTKSSDFHQNTAQDHLITSVNDSDIFGDFIF
ncbi:hypothetical protein PTTG_27102 [Puccinia triticina 1-1 BBBD Race 1]|uniref:Uncharacterized protein n=2 Tax=Puccinia triticina TaxID=208348 RepID=A0A180GP13_PUCT1|nr:uncharacterized protein PtA15_1A997 [Puccinia triticina]OAV94149.1 hypothetical protein PTTG_27102 [Puccinia triticina 1-1 BBBD Race 1]WAQ81655.1 hypothetical protein PtA15_1A997 [Puccinia triticina]WAR52543.1 hypothetical protein PtB15_1B985 [Puccinia triticina]